MAKRVLLALAVSVFAVTGAFAQSIGFGYIFNTGFIGYYETDNYNFTQNQNMHIKGSGGFAFLDFGALEMSVGLTGGSWKQELNRVEAYNGSLTTLDLGLLGKLPAHSPLFLLLGIGYNAILGAKDADGNDPFENMPDVNASDFSTFRFLFGLGLDIGFSNSTFFRVESMGRYALAPKYFKDIANNVGSGTAHGDIGFMLKLALGFRL